MRLLFRISCVWMTSFFLRVFFFEFYFQKNKMKRCAPLGLKSCEWDNFLKQPAYMITFFHILKGIKKKKKKLNHCQILIATIHWSLNFPLFFFSYLCLFHCLQLCLFLFPFLSFLSKCFYVCLSISVYLAVSIHLFLSSCFYLAVSI